ncbi:plasminogen receptor (KT) [Orycteropus afer afer]|uniref:Plasminogen receptor (KT) n=1 Tax=Orycteropus afer afer TaxID=1230840 RepID=A0A8B7AEY0_ORYAF|nr:plasminogen receptor (KT) [Orycteropus afer afer]
MGFIFSKSMSENMKNQQEFMLMNTRLQVNLQIIILLNIESNALLISSEAENILETEKSKLQLPRGMITFESLEKTRREQSKFFIDK